MPPCIGVGNTREEGLRRADLIADYVRTAPVVAEPFTNPPGYNSIGANVAMLKAGPQAKPLRQGPRRQPGRPSTKATRRAVHGRPTRCSPARPTMSYAQIKDFNERMGGFGHLLFFGQGGFLDHADTMENIRLFAKEVLPRLRDLNPEAERATTRGG